MTYCSETRVTKTARRERVNSRALGPNPGRLIEITSSYLAPIWKHLAMLFKIEVAFCMVKFSYRYLEFPAFPNGVVIF
jgi:hypothetical protein